MSIAIFFIFCVSNHNLEKTNNCKNLSRRKIKYTILKKKKEKVIQIQTQIQKEIETEELNK